MVTLPVRQTGRFEIDIERVRNNDFVHRQIRPMPVGPGAVKICRRAFQSDLSSREQISVLLFPGIEVVTDRHEALFLDKNNGLNA